MLIVAVFAVIGMVTVGIMVLRWLEV